MKTLHKPILDIMTYYAEKFESKEVMGILKKMSVDDEVEAKAMVKFLGDLCDAVAEDSEAGVVVLNQPIHTVDAEKVCDVMYDYLDGLGYAVDHD